MVTNDNTQDKYDILLLMPSRNRTYVINTPSYGHTCISRYIAKSGFTSRIFGGNVRDCTVTMLDAINGKTKIVGFGCLQDNYMIAVHMVPVLKEYGITVIFGGPQADTMHEAEIRSYGVDFVSVGEGEITIDLLLRYLLRGEGSLSAIPGIRYIDEDGTYHDNGYPDLAQDLDAISMIDDSDKPFEGKTVTIMTGRGCPFSCAFCYEGTTKRVRLRSVGSVTGEIDNYLRRSKVPPAFFFADDTFTLRPERVRQFCREMKKRNLKWGCECHVGTLAKHPELIDEMVDAGLVGAQIGIESGNADVLKAYNKHIEPEQIVEIVKRFHEAGCLQLDGNIICGGALESPQTLEDSIQLAEKLLEVGHLMMNIYSAFFAPLPSTPMTNCPSKYEIQIWDDPYSYATDSMQTCVNRTNAMTREEIQEGRRLFDQRLKEKYLSEIEKLTYTELLRCAKTQDNRIYGGNLWVQYMPLVEHVYCFARNGFNYENLGVYEAVPVRTFYDLKYSNNVLCVGRHLLINDEKTFLERANGSVTFREMANILNTNIFKIMRMYRELRNKLLVYMERF